MSFKNLNILVLLRETGDPRPPARVITRGAGISDRGLRRIPNPADLTALEEALRLKDAFGARVTVLAIGPSRLEDILTLAFSMGADRGIRFNEHGLEGGDGVADARVLARIATIIAPTLIFSGNRLVDRGDDPALALAAAMSGIPCISAAVSLRLVNDRIDVLRKADRGGRQEVTAGFPAMVLFDEGETPRYPSVDDINRALSCQVEKWDLANLGLPFWEIGPTGSLLTLAEFGTPRFDPVRLVTPDANLPAFERITALLSGGIKAREGRTHLLSAEETADSLWRILCDEGVAQEGAS